MMFIKKRGFNLIASAVVFLSILAMLGKIMGGEFASISINMFQGAFGDNANHSVVGVLLAIFILQLINMLVSIIPYVLVFKSDIFENKTMNIVVGLQSTISLITLILSFCTLAIMGISGVPLGIGPILYSVFNIIAIFLHVLGTVLVANSHTQQNSQTTNTKNIEEKNLDLLLKYKDLLDKGVISEEDFNKKKEELL